MNRVLAPHRVRRAIRRSQVERSAWTLLVEAPDADAEDVPELATTEDQEPVKALPAPLPTQRSPWAFAFGARIGVRTISTASLRKMLSKARLNLVSRSWIRKRGRWLP